MAGIAALFILATPALAHGSVAITVPSAVNLGSVPSGTSSLSHQLGTVTVTATGVVLLLPSFTAAVSSSSFTTGAGGPSQTIAASSISYWSGPATATTGAQTPVPGQVDAAHSQNLSPSRTAFSSSGLVLSISTSWNPTIVVDIPAAAVAGTYTGTITHSVA
jgi:hypothetical protein